MKPLSQLQPRMLRGLRILLTDIDDTITTAGQLTAQSYAALEELQQSGLAVIPVTGRPAGWCDHIARMWPVDGIIGENGAFYFSYDRVGKRMRQEFWTDLNDIRANRIRLDALALDILTAIPGAALASDQSYRLADLAIDFCEDVSPLPERDVERIVSMFNAAGAVAKVSSIHVNGWYGDYDKLTMTRRMLRQEFGLDEQQSDKAVIFVGDSPIDEPMFSAFSASVGVANVHDMAHRIKSLPGYVTERRSGHGFVELADVILAARRRFA